MFLQFGVVLCGGLFGFCLFVFQFGDKITVIHSLMVQIIV